MMRFICGSLRFNEHVSCLVRHLLSDVGSQNEVTLVGVCKKGYLHRFRAMQS